MSSTAVKENQGVCSVRKNSDSGEFCDIFLLDQPTGRPSILRQSQTDNINRMAHKGTKVCFQTPLRDPVTKRIMSPNRTSGKTIQEGNTKTLVTDADLNSVSSTSTTPINVQNDLISLPGEDIPIPSRGAYTFDLDNLDAVNPFLGSNKMSNSPPKSDLPGSWATVSEPRDDQKVFDAADTPLDETLPFIQSVENSLAENSADLSSVDGTVIVKTDNIEKSITDAEESDLTEPLPETQQIPVMKDEAHDSPLPPAGLYNLDFDNLESLNPFQTGGSKIPNSPAPVNNVRVSDPPQPGQEVTQEPEISVQTPSTVPGQPQEKPAITEVSPPKENPPLLEFNFNDGAEVKCKPPPKQLGMKRPAGAKPVAKKADAVVSQKKSPEPKQLSSENSEVTEPVDIAPVTGSYTFDFDKFDDPNFNPFGTKAKMGNSPPRGIQTSPVLEQETVPAERPETSGHDEQPEAPALKDPEHRSPSAISENTEKVTEPEVAVKVQTADDVKALAAIHIKKPQSPVTEEPEISVKTPPTVHAPSQSQEKPTITEVSPPKENQMLLEFNFNDGAEVKCKPPPKRLGMKRPAGAKPVAKKADTVVSQKKSPEPKPLSSENSEVTEPVDIAPVTGSYSFEFDKFDDPNFNPFGTKAKMGNSPPRGIQTSPVMEQEAVPAEQPETPALTDPEHQSPSAISENKEKVVEPEVSVQVQTTDDAEALAAIHIKKPQSPVIEEPEITAIPEPKKDVHNLTCDLGVATSSADEFVPGEFFMPGEDFDGQIDYLEQFGSSNFKESALRKQSLYLKFDPLLKESPKKAAMENGGFCMPRPSLAIRMMEAAKSEGKRKSQCNNVKLLDDVPPPVVDSVAVPDPTVLDLLVPTLKQPVKMEESIIEVLKYSQKDMDAALQRAERQAEERHQQLHAQNEALRLENQHMLFIVSEFEATITQITDEHKQKEDLAKIELERVLQEKEQLAKDLNEFERSFSSVVKRLDRCKEVIEGFKKNEETLKQYAQNCMDRLQKEEKRYQALKAHAEEKLDHANKAIADIRTKMGAEVATLQVQLKREQLKVQSLERDLEQKAKEVKDVTELCDELLLKVQKHGF